jgi:hypothetical protein
VYWKLGLALCAIVAAAALAAFAEIASIGASDSCNGCDNTPPWAEVLGWVANVALALWLVIAGAIAFGALRRTRRSSS